MIPKFKFTFNLALSLILLVLVVAISVRNPNFISYNYMSSVVIKNVMELGMMALPMTLIVITGGIDLSVGSTMILAAISGGLAASVYGDVVGILVTLVVGMLCGLVNGVVIAKLKISALITTLATFFLFRGVARGLTSGDSVYTYPFASFMGNQEVAGMPLAVFFYAACVVTFTLLLSKSAMGRSLYAIGLNQDAARYAGLKVDNILLRIYVISGAVCALSAFFYLGRFTSVKFDVANSMNLSVVTIIVLGGTSVLGGIGNMSGTVIATFIIAVLKSGLTVMNIPIDVQTIVQGTVLILSLIVYALVGDRARRKKILEVARDQPVRVRA